MIDQERSELLALLRDLSEACPDYRLGQMLLNLAFLAKDDGDQNLWNMTDADLIAACRQHLADRSGSMTPTALAASRAKKF